MQPSKVRRSRSPQHRLRVPFERSSVRCGGLIMPRSPGPRRYRWLRRTLKVTLIFVLVLIVAAGSYLGYITFRHAQVVSLPAPGGPHRVARVMTEWTDHTRIDPLAPRSGVARQLSVWL